jgi:hypothetical protein
VPPKLKVKKVNVHPVVVAHAAPYVTESIVKTSVFSQSSSVAVAGNVAKLNLIKHM